MPAYFYTLRGVSGAWSKNGSKTAAEPFMIAYCTGLQERERENIEVRGKVR